MATAPKIEVHIAGPRDEDGAQRCLRCDEVVTQGDPFPVGALVGLSDHVSGPMRVRDHDLANPNMHVCSYYESMPVEQPVMAIEDET